MLDPSIVAAAATPFVLRAVEFLGEKVLDKASDAAADEAAGFGRRLLARLLRLKAGSEADAVAGADAGALPGSDVAVHGASSGQLVVVEAVKDLVSDPQDQDAQAALRLAVRRLLVADPVLMAELVEREASQQRARDRSIQVGGAQSGGLNVTGDRNRLSYGGPGRT